ncbi:kinetochore protein NDC80 [Marchantia polymorpha subsp. ruderalis]|uniref:Kinetochore protein NDC80 n=2 Tax=Marchantia polymorpha TaxID=3197 RepID=A0A176W1S2_MARPO|nr:hypothetical protein AXG93_903s1170 [Marchantia polymorpha subsp. ruderalis]PTQ40053.1 hypothetical protein MARPO_0042s0088 [Marchantia polymorpha]BBN02358.1 hypothetical protein Mp_2g14660 [Marchantia polymorpha subsp. ruderalis]|eukprot:PTQ40053.1 hypothetical protein MARPO_0042s0088 [Marchantia polymorpha]
MRRATLGSMSPSQLNTRGATNGRAKGSRGSLIPRPPPAGASNVIKPSRPSMGRRSSMMGKGSGTQTETRPIGDRAFQQDCIRNLCNYLTTHGYVNAVSPKVLQAPSSKDVTSIIQFLFHQVDPNYKFMKIEEDVPIFFKRIGYPVQISRSALYAAGSPVSWPSLLAALTWLSQLLVAMESSSEGPDFSPFDDVRGNLLTDYINENYMNYLAGKDDEVDRLDEEFRKQFVQEKEKDAAECEQLQATLNKLKEEMQRAKNEMSPLVALETKKRDFQDDIVKFNQIITGFTAHKQALEKKVNEKRQELTTKKEEVLNTLKENEELKETVAAQQINAADVEKMLKEKEILDVNLQSLMSRKEELEKAAWNFEVQSSKKLRDLETKVNQFNDSCQRLKPTTGEDSHEAYQFEIKLQPRADTPDEILGGTLKTVLKPGFTELMDTCRKRLTEELEPETLKLQQQIFSREIAGRKKAEQIAAATAHIKKLEAQYNVRMDKLNAILAAKIAEREEYEMRTVTEEAEFRKLQVDVEQRLRELQVELDNTLRICQEEIEFEKNEGTEILEIILSTKERTQAMLKRVTDVSIQSTQVFHELLLSP